MSNAKPEMHYWSSGMPRKEAQLYLLDLCGSDSQQYTERPEEVTCERCLAALRAGSGASGAGASSSAPRAPEGDGALVAVAAAPTFQSTIELLKKRKEFEYELQHLINRLSLESTFGNRPDFELARLAWEYLAR